MQQHLRKCAPLSIALMLAGCDVASMGGVNMSATVPVNPGPGIAYASFQADADKCKKWADQIMLPVAQKLMNAVPGLLLGAAMGQDVSQVPQPPDSVISPQFAGMTPQQQFDIVYAQCMYANGNDVPNFEANKYVLPAPPGTPGYVPPVTTTPTASYSPQGSPNYSPYTAPAASSYSPYTTPAASQRTYAPSAPAAGYIPPPPSGAPPPPPPPGSAPPS